VVERKTRADDGVWRVCLLLPNPKLKPKSIVGAFRDLRRSVWLLDICTYKYEEHTLRRACAFGRALPSSEQAP
jgi:hypothetical protein